VPGNTLNQPEQCALTTGPRMHAYGTKSIDFAACSRAKVGPLARIRIADDVYIRTLLAAAFGNISHAAEVAYGAERKDTHTKSPTALASATSRTPPRSRTAPSSRTQRAPSCVLYGAVAHDMPLK